MTLEGSQSQQLPGGINFSRLSPVELLGNLLGDKNIYICRGQTENRGLRRPGQVGEGLAFRGSCGAAGARCGCPPGGSCLSPSRSPHPRAGLLPEESLVEPRVGSAVTELAPSRPRPPAYRSRALPFSPLEPPRWGLAG